MCHEQQSVKLKNTHTYCIGDDKYNGERAEWGQTLSGSSVQYTPETHQNQSLTRLLEKIQAGKPP